MLIRVCFKIRLHLEDGTVLITAFSLRYASDDFSERLPGIGFEDKVAVVGSFLKDSLSFYDTSNSGRNAGGDKIFQGYIMRTTQIASPFGCPIGVDKKNHLDADTAPAWPVCMISWTWINRVAY